MQIAVGTIIAGKYQLERPLARGGMGSVWVARHVKLGTSLAVKFLDARFATTPAFIDRFEREARAAATLQSPNVVHVQDYGVEDDTPYLVMELLRGEDLSARLARVGRLSLQETSRILHQIGKALRKAHEAGIVHRDLKPANLFITSVDEEEIVKVLDFGIAKETQGAIGEATKTGETMGSPHYMSPEQARADKGIDHRSDLWSMGVILYRMVTGVLPFQGEVIGAVLSRILVEPVPPVADSAPDLPGAVLDKFFARALAKSKEQRFQSIRELVDAFLAISGAVPLTTSGQAWLVTTTATLPTPDADNQATIPLASSKAPGQAQESSPRTITTASMARDAVPRPRRGISAWWIAGALVLAGAASLLLWSGFVPRGGSSASQPPPAAVTSPTAGSTEILDSPRPTSEPSANASASSSSGTDTPVGGPLPIGSTSASPTSTATVTAIVTAPPTSSVTGGRPPTPSQRKGNTGSPAPAETPSGWGF